MILDCILSRMVHRDKSGNKISKVDINEILTKSVSNLSINQKLNFGFGIIVGISFLIIGRNFISSVLATRNIHQTQELRIPATLTSSQAQEELLKMSSHVRGYLVTGESRFRDDFYQSRQEFENELFQLAKLLQQDTSPNTYDDLQQLRTVYQEWIILPEQLFALRDDVIGNQPALKKFSEDGEELILSLQSQTTALIKLQSHRSPSAMNVTLLKEMADFQTSLALLVSSLRAYLLTQDVAFQFEYADHVLDNQATWEILINSQANLSESQWEIIKNIEQQHSAFMALPDQLFEIVESDRYRSDLLLFRTQSEPLVTQMLSLLDEMVTYQHDLLAAELAKGRNELAIAQWHMILGGFGVLGIAMVMTALLRRKISAPIGRLTFAASRIIDGNFDAKAIVESGDEILESGDEIGLLARTFNRMTQTLRQSHQDLEAYNQNLQQHSQELEQKNYQLGHTLEELKDTQLQLIQTEKMSSLGQMVAGVAHELNNPVCFIEGNLVPVESYANNLIELIQLYQKHYPEADQEILNKINEIDVEFLIKDLPKILISMQIGTERISQIVLSLRNFSRLDEAEMKLADINEGIDNTVMILRNRLKEQPYRPEIEIIRDYRSDDLVECYPGQLNQVFMNILNNAIDAIDELFPEEKEFPVEFYDWQPNILIRTEQASQFFIVTIIDNGPGIPESVQCRLFDPFFTTKPVGKGTGLGLSISHQIVVEKHGGELSCHSRIDEGTTFEIRIPLIHGESTLPSRNQESYKPTKILHLIH
ncbi:MAG: HAMP domain-containing protein [Symploca sp. SIO2B6]|nr:HAMP domain-containing protein [Symploca sp. SIO2B6]